MLTEPMYLYNLLRRLMVLERRSSGLPRPSPPTEQERLHYYDGLSSGSQPTVVLVARSSTTPWIQGKRKDTYGWGGTFRRTWHDEKSGLSKRIHKILDDLKIEWNCIEVMRIGDEDGGTQLYLPPRPIVLWIGVPPGTLSPEAGIEAVVKCKEAIMFHGIKDEDLDQDIEVEIFEAIIRHWPQWS